MREPLGILDVACPLAREHHLNRVLYAEWAMVPLSGWNHPPRDLVRGLRAPHDGAPSGAKVAGGNILSPYGSRLCTGGNGFTLPFPAITANDSFSLVITHRPTTWPGGFTTLLDDFTGGVRQWSLFCDTSGNISFNGGMLNTGGSLGMTAGHSWQFVATRNRVTGDLAYYVNGKSISTGNGGNPTAAAANVSFGPNPSGGGSTYDGRYSSVMLYWDQTTTGSAFANAKAVLSATEVQQLFLETLRGNRNRWNWQSPKTYFVPGGGGAAFTLSAAPGSLRSAGSPAGLSAGRILAAGSASLRIAPSPAALVAGRMLAAGVRNLTLAGSSASLTRGQALAAGTSVLRLTGAQAALLPGRGLAAPPGMLRIVGSPAELVYTPAGSFTLAVAAGSLRLRGAAASLLTSRVLSAGIARLRLVPATASLTHGYTLAMAPGALRLRGGLAGFARTYVLAAGTRRLRLAGTPASLNVSTAIFRKASITGTYTPARSLAGTNIPQRTLTGD